MPSSDCKAINVGRWRIVQATLNRLFSLVIKTFNTGNFGSHQWAGWSLPIYELFVCSWIMWLLFLQAWGQPCLWKSILPNSWCMPPLNPYARTTILAATNNMLNTLWPELCCASQYLQMLLPSSLQHVFWVEPNFWSDWIKDWWSAAINGYGAQNGVWADIG